MNEDIKEEMNEEVNEEVNEEIAAQETAPEETPQETAPGETPQEATAEEAMQETAPGEIPQEATAEEATQETAPQETPQEAPSKKTTKTHHGRYFLLGAFLGIVLTLCVCVIATGLINFPFLLSRVVGSNPAETVQDTDRSDGKLNYTAINLKMRVIKEILDKEYYYTMDAQEIEDGIFTGMLYGLTNEDRYAAYYPAQESADRLNSIEGNYYGIGALVSQDQETMECSVEEIYKDSPAEEGGLMVGDILRKVNQEDISGMDLSTIVEDYIKGPEGSIVNLTVEREGQMLDLQIRRGKVSVPTVYSKLLPETDTYGKTGYLYISTFNEACVSQFQDELDGLLADGAEGIVIDLRENLGGMMDSALKLLDYLLPDRIDTYSQTDADGDNRGKTLLLYTETKEGRTESFYASDGHETEIPIVLLVNGNSASASEIFAGTMKDYHKATIVGTLTYGKGIVQTEIALPDGSAIKYTSAQYFTPSGYAVHEKGVVPDVESEADETFLAAGLDVKNPDPNVDNQLRDALTALYQQQS